MKKIKTLLLTSLSFFFSICLFSQISTIVETDKVKKEIIDQAVPMIGSIIPKRDSNLMSSVSGRIDKVLVQEGERVRKGKVLAHIDRKNYEWLHEISSSNLQKAKLYYETSKIETVINNLDYERMGALRSTSAFNASKFDKLKNTKLILESKEAIALAELNIEKNKNKIAKLNLEKSSLRAPFSGVIEKKMIEVGEVVSVGSKMFNLVDKDTLEVFAEIPSFRTYGLELGNIIEVTTPDNIKLNAEIRAIGSKENPTTRTVKIFLDFIQNDISRKLLVGENINLLIPIGLGKTAITVHKDAILKREGMSLVYLVIEDIVQIRPIKLGEAVGNRFIVTDGLQDNDKVVIKGNERLIPGQEVKIVNKK